MEESILDSTKKILGIAPEYTEFDEDILGHINSAFGVIAQLGLGPPGGFSIIDSFAQWADFANVDLVLMPINDLSMIKNYIYLKTKFMFDPPQPAYNHAAHAEQIKELEWRLSASREVALHPYIEPIEEVEV